MARPQLPPMDRRASALPEHAVTHLSVRTMKGPVSGRMPDSSGSVQIGRWRYVQSLHERGERRNPDTAVKRFFSLVERLQLRWLGEDDLARLRAEPSYYYLAARTRYYDQVFCDAVSGGVRQILNVGCGTDTRSHRFAMSLRSNDVLVLECDLEEAILVKERLAEHWDGFNRIQYLPIDLNDGEWPALSDWLLGHSGAKTLVMMEGVSPYVNHDAFGRFLELLGGMLTAGSEVAYDFKFRGVDDEFGRRGRTVNPFRQPRTHDEVAAFHRPRGFRLDSLESSADLSLRLLADAGDTPEKLFGEDGLVRLTVVNGR